MIGIQALKQLRFQEVKWSGDDKPIAGEGVPTTAATSAFRRDLSPVTGPDGGFIHPHTDTEEN